MELKEREAPHESVALLFHTITHCQNARILKTVFSYLHAPEYHHLHLSPWPPSLAISLQCEVRVLHVGLCSISKEVSLYYNRKLTSCSLVSFVSLVLHPVSQNAPMVNVTHFEKVDLLEESTQSQH